MYSTFIDEFKVIKHGKECNEVSNLYTGNVRETIKSNKGGLDMRNTTQQGNNKGGYCMRTGTFYFGLVLCFIGALSFNLNTHAVVGKAIKEIVEEGLEYLLKKGGQEVVESLEKKVGKEMMKEMTERAVREVGEEGAKRLFRELGEQALRHGDDAFLVASRYGVSETVKMLKELPEEMAKSSMKALLNRGDDLMPLVRRFGSEILEVEAKHPGLSPHIAREFGDEGLKVMKNYRTEQVLQILRRKDILNSLTNEGKKELCRKLDIPRTAEQIIYIFEKNPDRTNALVQLSKVIGGVGGVYIVSEKFLSSDIKKQLPDGKVVTDEISVLQNKTIKQNPDGSIEENTLSIIGSLVYGLVHGGGVFYFFIIVGTAIGLFFIIRGLAPIFIKDRK